MFRDDFPRYQTFANANSAIQFAQQKLRQQPLALDAAPELLIRSDLSKSSLSVYELRPIWRRHGINLLDKIDQLKLGSVPKVSAKLKFPLKLAIQ